jgi:hypothetical protein
MSITAASVITRVRELLVDTGDPPRWTDAELLRHLSDAQRAIARADPTAIQKVATMSLVEGTRQSLPEDGESLLVITRNMGTNGTTPGRAIRIIRRDIMDDQNPNWHSDPKVLAVYNYIYDPTDAKAFFVYPPSNGQGHIELSYCYIPAELEETTDELDVDDMYITPLTDYVVFRALQKDSDFAAGMQRARMHFDAFVTFMGVDGEADVNPNLQTIPFDPNKKGTAR